MVFLILLRNREWNDTIILSYLENILNLQQTIFKVVDILIGPRVIAKRKFIDEFITETVYPSIGFSSSAVEHAMVNSYSLYIDVKIKTTLTMIMTT